MYTVYEIGLILQEEFMYNRKCWLPVFELPCRTEIPSRIMEISGPDRE